MFVSIGTVRIRQYESPGRRSLLAGNTDRLCLNNRIIGTEQAATLEKFIHYLKKNDTVAINSSVSCYMNFSVMSITVGIKQQKTCDISFSLKPPVP